MLRILCAAIMMAAGLLGVSFGADLGRETKMDSVLASVNGEPITLLDVLIEGGRDESRLSVMFSGDALYKETYKFRRKIVDEIVARRLVYESYKAKPFPIDRQYVEDMLDSLARSMGDGTRSGLERKAKQMGTTLDELKEKAKERIAVDVMLMEFCDRKVSITPKEVYEHYQEHPEEWTAPARVELQLLMVAAKEGRDMESACAEVRRKLDEAGTSLEGFKKVAAQLSEGPSASSGGMMGEIDRDKLRPEFEKALEGAISGQVMGPVKTDEGSYFIRVVSETKPETEPFEKASRQIRLRLESKAKEAKRVEYVERLKGKSVINYYF